MKLRVNANSIRFRLNRPDVAELIRTGAVEQSVRFGPGSENTFRYRVAADPGGRIFASFSSSTISVFVPDERIRQWAASSQIGFDCRLVIDEDTDLMILVEKDFACVSRNTG